MPALVAGIHVFLAASLSKQSKTWMAGPSPAMTMKGHSHTRCIRTSTGGPLRMV